MTVAAIEDSEKLLFDQDLRQIWWNCFAFDLEYIYDVENLVNESQGWRMLCQIGIVIAIW